MKKLLAIGLACVLLLSCFTGCNNKDDNPYADLPESPVEDFEYTVHEDHITITYYKGDDTTVVIPKEIEGLPVTTIGMAFSPSPANIEIVVLPDTVITILPQAFSHCETLKDIYLGKQLKTVGSHAFEECSSLKSMYFPNTLTAIENDAFFNCTSLESVEINGTDVIIGINAFLNTTSLKRLVLNGVKSIGYAAFGNAGEIESLTIPTSVTEIDDGAFAGCPKLTEVKFLGNLPTSLGELSFASPNNIVTIYHKKDAQGLDNPSLSAYTLVEYES